LTQKKSTEVFLWFFLFDSKRKNSAFLLLTFLFSEKKSKSHSLEASISRVQQKAGETLGVGGGVGEENGEEAVLGAEGDDRAAGGIPEAVAVAGPDQAQEGVGPLGDVEAVAAGGVHAAGALGDGQVHRPGGQEHAAVYAAVLGQHGSVTSHIVKAGEQAGVACHAVQVAGVGIGAGDAGAAA